ncbi:MAG: cytochrome D1 domain-containing protein [Bryobacteraceae bacterium]
MRFSLGLLAALSVFFLSAACSSSPEATASAHNASSPSKTAPSLNLLPGMPPVNDPNDIYSADRPNELSPAVQGFPSLVYVPNSKSNSVSIVDPKTFKVIRSFPVGKEPQHVVPSWDLKKLWVAQDLQDQLTLIDPATGQKGETIHVDDPYNVYFTPDGKYAIICAEREKRLDFRDAQTMKVVHRVPVPCDGVNHIDYSIDGRYLLATCEFSGELLKVDVANQKVMGTLKLKPAGMPQDIKLSPDGKLFYVANMEANGVHVVDGDNLKTISFIPTGKGAHGLYVSRDSKYLYVANRGEGSVTLIDFRTREIVAKWKIPGGGSPDMGGVSADGKQLWLSGRYDSVVYVFDTSDGHLLAKIPVGKGPHGLCVYPQPGRYSLGHTGIFR